MIMSITTMRNKYHLKCDAVIDHLEEIVPLTQISNYNYRLHQNALRVLCGNNANCAEFRNAKRCLDAKVGR